MVLVVRYLARLGVVSSVEASSGQKGKRGIVSLKGIFESAQKRREVKDSFEKKVVEKNLSYGLASF